MNFHQRNWLQGKYTGYKTNYWKKDASSAKLFEAVRAAARGESFLQPSVAAKVVAEFARLAQHAPRAETPVETLSERELAVLRLVAQGASNKEIASALFIAEGAVKNHLTNILSKLDAAVVPLRSG